MIKENAGNFSLPYDVDLSIMEKVLEVLQMERQGTSTTDLFKKIDVKHASLKSNALKMCKFLGLVDVEATSVSLSSLGSKYFFSPLSERKAFLGKNLPSPYKVLLLWVKSRPAGVSLNELASSAIDAWGKPPNEKTFKSMLNTFARSGEYTGVLQYLKGGIGKCIITDFGKSALLGNQEQTNMPKSVEDTHTTEEKWTLAKEPSPSFVSNAKNVIRILAKVEGKTLPPMEIEVEFEEDLEQVEAFKKSYARRMKKK